MESYPCRNSLRYCYVEEAYIQAADKSQTPNSRRRPAIASKASWHRPASTSASPRRIAALISSRGCESYHWSNSSSSDASSLCRANRSSTNCWKLARSSRTVDYGKPPGLLHLTRFHLNRPPRRFLQETQKRPVVFGRANRYCEPMFTFCRGAPRIRKEQKTVAMRIDFRGWRRC